MGAALSGRFLEGTRPRGEVSLRGGSINMVAQAQVVKDKDSWLNAVGEFGSAVDAVDFPEIKKFMWC